MRVHRSCSAGAPSSHWVNFRGPVLEDPERMLAWVGVVVTVLASPAGHGVAQPVSSDVLSSSLARPTPECTATERLEGWLSNLAVVRRRPGGPGASSPMLFVAVTPVGRHGMGLQAIGSF